jgi:hypothetical protein
MGVFYGKRGIEDESKRAGQAADTGDGEKWEDKAPESSRAIDDQLQALQEDQWAI